MGAVNLITMNKSKRVTIPTNAKVKSIKLFLFMYFGDNSYSEGLKRATFKGTLH